MIPRFAALFLFSFVLAQGAEISLLRVPEGGIQPQVATDEKGNVHLIYYKGEAGGGDVFYARLESGAKAFSKPTQVNKQPGSAISAGTIRGAHIAIGKNGRVHVAWMGGKGATPAVVDGKNVTPMLYARMADNGKSFEPERNVITHAAGLDGGGALAADHAGNVYVTWHGSEPGNTKGEDGRSVFMALSRDDGKTFAKERAIVPQPVGACGCCGMNAFANANGELFVMFRSAVEKMDRNEIVLASTDQGRTFKMLDLDQWRIPTCPMSSVSLQPAAGGTIVAWETDGKVQAGFIKAGLSEKPKFLTPSGQAKRKHAAAAVNSSGDVLMAWTEGTGWQRGGVLCYQLLDKEGRAKGEVARVEQGIPVWSLPAVAVMGKDQFVLIH